MTAAAGSRGRAAHTLLPRDARPVALTLFAGLVLLAGCASSGNDADATAVRARMDGDRLLDAGDYVGASRAYDRQLQAAEDSPAVRERVRTARLLGAKRLADNALRFAERGESDRAMAAIEGAERLWKGHAYVRRARAQVEALAGGDARARSLRDAGRDALLDDPSGAVDLLAEAREADPNDPRTVALLREATLRSEADRAAQRAGRAWDQGERKRALRDLAVAQFGGRPVPAADALRDVIAFDVLSEAEEGDLLTAAGALSVATRAGLRARDVRAVRSAYGTRLIAERDRLLRDGRPALAALHEVAAERSGARAGTRARTEAAERARLVIFVPPFADPTGAVDGTAVARLTAERLAADARHGGIAISVLGPEDAGVATAHPRALVVDAVIEQSRVGQGPHAATSRNVETRVGERLESNPAAAAAADRLKQARQDLAHVDENLAAANAELRALRASPFSGSRRNSAESLDLAMARARELVKALETQRAELRTEEQKARRAVVAAPPTRRVDVTESRRVKITSFRKAAVVTARVRLLDSGAVLLDERISGSAVHDERFHDGVPGADLAEDPDESPDDLGMAGLAEEHLARLVAARLRSAAAQGAGRYLTAADAALAAGRTSDATEGYALYLLVTPDVASEARERAARALRETAGFEPPVRRLR